MIFTKQSSAISQNSGSINSLNFKKFQTKTWHARSSAFGLSAASSKCWGLICKYQANYKQWFFPFKRFD